MSNRKERIENLRVALMWYACRATAIMPYWFRYYVLQEVIYFLLRYVVRYRRALILRQLADSFPDKSAEQIKQICAKYYQTLAEMFVNTISLAGIDDRQRAERLLFDEQASMGDVIKGRNVVVLTSHYGFWEYATFAKLAYREHEIVAAYHPLKQPAWDRFYRRLRTMDHVVHVSSAMYLRYFMNNKDGINGHNLILGLIADQNCPPVRGCKWHRFLNHDTLFYDGGEQLAMKYGMPVYYLCLERVKRGQYIARFTQIYDGVEQLPQGEITSRYARLLERDITAHPELWMWSHNRWKFGKWEDGEVYVPLADR